MTVYRLLLFSSLLVSAAAVAIESSLQVIDAPPIGLAGAEDSAETRVYIVQLRQPSTAEHYAKLSGPAARTTLVDKQRSRLDKTSPQLEAYRSQLVDEQDKVLGIGRARRAEDLQLSIWPERFRSPHEPGAGG